MFQKKQIFKLNVLKKLLNDENGCVFLVPSTRLLALPPFFLNDMKSGILYLLNCMLKKYDRSLGGIVIGYQNVKVLMDENTGIIPMGTPEMEVNISVEFYIFQPKIGSLLEGVINKKSNNHIGCLVHQYFNATILKPEGVDFDDWTCKDFNVDDKIIFKVKDLDFTSLLPYIEGVVDENLVHKGSVGGSDKINVINKDLHDVSCAKESLNRINMSEGFHNKFIENTEKKNWNEEEVKTLEAGVNRVVRKSDSHTGTKKKKKKEKEKVPLCTGDGDEKKEGESSNERGVSSGCGEIKLKADNTSGEKKKKTKQNKEKEADFVAMEENDLDVNFGKGVSVQEYVPHLENDDSNDFVTPVKLKKEKKKKKDNESLNKTFECVPPRGEDNVFYSTQLEPNSESKMMISFCSPIPRAMSLEAREDGRRSTMQDSSSKIIGTEKERKKKQKKRRRDEEDEQENVPKKLKSSSDSSPISNSVKTEKSEAEKMVEELYKQQVSRLMGDVNMSEKASFKEKKSPKKKGTRQKREETEGSEVVEDEEMSERHSKGDGLGQQELGAFNRENNSGANKSMEETLNKSLKAKKVSKAQPSVVGSGDKLHKELTDEDNIKEGKKPKNMENKGEVSREKNNDSLYEKLLKEARNAIDFEKCQPSTILPTKKKDSELSDLSSSSSRRRSSKKKGKHKEKVKDYNQTPDKYKNGSMYDVAHTPEKVSPDKSLFTDSEQSYMSPAKKRKEVNGVETVREEKAKVQNMLNEFWREEVTKTKNESGKKVPKYLDKSETDEKSKRNPQSHGPVKESLYEKLLTQAKKLVDIKESSSEGKEKSGNKYKKQSTIQEYLKSLD